MMTVGIGAIALMWGDGSPMRAVEMPSFQSGRHLGSLAEGTGQAGGCNPLIGGTSAKSEQLGLTVPGAIHESPRGLRILPGARCAPGFLEAPISGTSPESGKTLSITAAFFETAATHAWLPGRSCSKKASRQTEHTC
jgi:hypothetical protein